MGIARAAVLGVIWIGLPATSAVAQSIGTFAWKLDPFCDVVTFTVTADGPAFRLTGFDQPCGGAKVPAAGIVVPNPDGTFTLAFYLVTAQGLSSHTTATLAPPSYSGPWRDATGQAGTLSFGGGSGGGTPRPVAAVQQRVAGACTGSEFVQKVREDGSVECGAAPAGAGGDITGVTAGTGLSGGGSAGELALSIASGGVGSVQIADGSIGAADVDAAQVQRRVAAACAGGAFIIGIGSDGQPQCSSGSARASSAALGFGALAADTGGSNVGVGTRALNVNTTGYWNVAVGSGALINNVGGEGNTALGYLALQHNTDGYHNTALGRQALQANTTGVENIAVGHFALIDNTAGQLNTAVGWRALHQNTVGSYNIAVGRDALSSLTTGERNIAIGDLAGRFATTGDDNIFIGNGGVAGDDVTVRIGSVQNRTFVAGVRGRITGHADAVNVVVDSFGQLGTLSSSRRSKQDIHDMADASDGLFRLRPVTFRYIQPYADGSKPIDYGLIAEEVEEVYPDLVARNAAGEVETVQYHKLTPMLLNEVQRLRRELDTLRIRLAALEESRR